MMSFRVCLFALSGGISAHEQSIPFASFRKPHECLFMNRRYTNFYFRWAFWGQNTNKHKYSAVKLMRIYYMYVRSVDFSCWEFGWVCYNIWQWEIFWKTSTAFQRIFSCWYSVQTETSTQILYSFIPSAPDGEKWASYHLHNSSVS